MTIVKIAVYSLFVAFARGRTVCSVPVNQSAPTRGCDARDGRLVTNACYLYWRTRDSNGPTTDMTRQLLNALLGFYRIAILQCCQIYIIGGTQVVAIRIPRRGFGHIFRSEFREIQEVGTAADNNFEFHFLSFH